MPIKFLASKNTIVFGQTGVGKTHFILEVIRQKLIEPFPNVIYYMYNIEQDFMKTWNESEDQEICFIKGLDFEKVISSKENPAMVIIDDLVLSTNKSAAETFIYGSHHMSISLFFLTQNLFYNCEFFRTMSKNSHYLMIFKNQRNFSQVMTIARQAGLTKRVKNAYKRACRLERGFIVLSYAPELPEEITVVTDWWEPCPSVYL